MQQGRLQLCKWLLLCFLLPWVGVQAAGPPPIIDVQPLSQTVLKGSSATFLVAATSITTMSYQWKRNGASISGATQSSYTVLSANSDAIYSVVVINASGSVTSSNATLHVVRAPQSQNDSYSIPQDHTLTVLAPGVLSNDEDSNGLLLTAVLGRSVTNGTLLLNLDGSFVYTPNPGFYGSDSFTYVANDGLFSGNTATVKITVQQIIDAPLILTPTGMVTNGFQLQLSGPAPATYVIFASDDLQNWTPILTNSVTSGFLQVVDTTASSHPNQFYRAVARKSW